MRREKSGLNGSKRSKDPVIVKWESENRTQLQGKLSSYETAFKEREAVYVSANAKTAESVLALCKVVADMWCEFVQLPDYLYEFRVRTHLKNKSTFSQHLTVGRSYDRLMEHVQQLPSSWYTLYQIARLKDETYAAAVAAGKIHPRMTQRDVDVLAGRTKAADARPYLQVEFFPEQPLTASDVEAFQSALLTFLHAQPTPFKTGIVSWSKAVQNTIRPPKQKKRGEQRNTAAPVATPPSRTPFEKLPEDLRKFFPPVAA